MTLKGLRYAVDGDKIAFDSRCLICRYVGGTKRGPRIGISFGKRGFVVLLLLPWIFVMS
jgi:hypothetical protein